MIILIVSCSNARVACSMIGLERSFDEINEIMTLNVANVTVEFM